jgi:multidrug efflux system membrane fusion protein
VEATTQDVPVYLSGIGNVTPVYSVTVKARVDGQLEKVAFTEGQDIKTGGLLAQIDARPYQAAYDQAVATKARDQATLANAIVDLERYRKLWQEDSIPQQQLATQEATVDQLKATVQADQAQIETAKTQLDYTTIRSPIDGRTGVRLVDPGNIMRATDTNGIVVINQIDPITVLFTLPEGKFQNINDAIREHANTPLEVRAYAQVDGALLGTGKLLLINNQIDTATGTFQVKALFPNAAHKLWPGQYVNARVTLGVRRGAVTIPESAVQRGPDGLYTYVVAPDESVAMQPIHVAFAQDGKAILEEGLAAGTRVVADGQYKLKPGALIAEAQQATVPAAIAKSGKK